jgi:uncharacterized membrane protein HdeD (DUF308 family)
LLGLVLLAGGIFVFFNVVLASVVSAIFFGAVVTVTGGFQIVHAFSSRGWGGFFLSLVIGVLFLLGGLLLMYNPLATSFGLTLGFAALLIAGGVVRIVLAFRHWDDLGWLLISSALLGIATGVVVLLGFPWAGLVVPGLLVGIDLILHGFWWLALGLWIRRPHQPNAPAGTPMPA